MLETVGWRSSSEGVLPGTLRLLDQTRLPLEVCYVETDDLGEVVAAIRRLVVRGAPAIGCAAALGLAAVAQHSAATSAETFLVELESHSSVLGAARPTAVNLQWALRRCLDRVRAAAAGAAPVAELKQVLVAAALALRDEDRALCRALGEHGVSLLGGERRPLLMTYCNAGALATAGTGTALALVYAAQERGLQPAVYVNETRPLLQGGRLTAWELQQANVEVTLICDNMAGQVLRDNGVVLVVVGADRIAANGDVANKIGTYGLAVLARYHGVPFYVAAPYSSVDPDMPNGAAIPIEQRDADEVRCGFGRQTVPSECPVHNPAFDVTPAALIDGIITEGGILRPPYPDALRRFLADRTGDSVPARPGPAESGRQPPERCGT